MTGADTDLCIRVDAMYFRLKDRLDTLNRHLGYGSALTKAVKEYTSVEGPMQLTSIDDQLTACETMAAEIEALEQKLETQTREGMERRYRQLLEATGFEGIEVVYTGK